MSLASHFELLNSLLPLLNSYRSGNCCKKARMSMLSVALKEIYELTDNIIIDKDDIDRDPEKYYIQLRNVILEDYSLSPTQKINLQKLI